MSQSNHHHHSHNKKRDQKQLAKQAQRLQMSNSDGMVKKHHSHQKDGGYSSKSPRPSSLEESKMSQSQKRAKTSSSRRREEQGESGSHDDNTYLSGGANNSTPKNENLNNESEEEERQNQELSERSESSRQQNEEQENDDGEDGDELFDANADFLSFDEIGKHKQKLSVQEAHVQKNYDREVNFPWLSDDTLSREGSQDLHGFLHNEILDYCKWIEPSPEDKASRQSLVKKIKRVVKESYPDAVVMVFGSCATGLNLPNSDIDLLVYYPEVKELSMLNKLCNTLVKQIDVMSIEALKHTKVPLIKLQEKHSKINVDISFNRTNGIYCVKLVKFLMKKYPELRPLILILKAFLKSRELNETYHGGVGSFLLTMLVTSYLQRHYKLGGTDKKDLGFHLIEFFNLYGNLFNYDQVGISIRKEGSYFSKDKKGWEQYDQNRCRLSVENPQDPDIDIGRPAYNIHRIKRAFQHAFDTLCYNNTGSISLLSMIITKNVLQRD